MFIVSMIGMPLVLRRVLMGISVAVRSAILIPMPIVAWAAVFRAIVAAPRVWLRLTATMHLLMLHRAIVGPTTTFRSRDRASLWPAKVRSLFVSRHDPWAVKFSRPRGSGDHWPTVIFGSEKRAIVAGTALVIPLHMGRFVVVLPAPHFLLVRWTRIDSAPAPVETDAVHSDIIDDGLVVDVNVGDGHIVHGAVVVEVAVSPIATFIAVAKVAEAIVHAAVEADVRSPVARMP